MKTKPTDMIKHASKSRDNQLMNAPLNVMNNWKMTEIEPFKLLPP